MKMICPCCDAEYIDDEIGALLFFAAKDEAKEQHVKDYFSVLTPLPETLVVALVRYIDLFRRGTSKIAWSKKAKLAREVLALIGRNKSSYNALAEALMRCHEVKNAERAAGTFSPFSNHRYLMPILQEKLNEIKAAPVPPKALKPVSRTVDIAPHEVRAKHERSPGMPPEIRAKYNEIFGKMKADNRSDEEREADFEAKKQATLNELAKKGVGV